MEFTLWLRLAIGNRRLHAPVSSRVVHKYDTINTIFGAKTRAPLVSFCDTSFSSQVYVSDPERPCEAFPSDSHARSLRPTGLYYSTVHARAGIIGEPHADSLVYAIRTKNFQYEIKHGTNLATSILRLQQLNGLVYPHAYLQYGPNFKVQGIPVRIMLLADCRKLALPDRG